MEPSSSAPVMTTLQKAASFATSRHRDQLRTDGVTPYFAHATRVALTILTAFQCDDAQVSHRGVAA